MGLISITNISVPWRDALLPASFRGALFHVEAGAKESGRRIVIHQYPKKDTPYAEDMGRRVRTFTVRGYCITFPVETGVPNYSRDYRTARDALIGALESSAGPGVLQLPTIEPIMVVNPQYRWSEEEKLGGYCVFDMTFVEFGSPPSAPEVSSVSNLTTYSQLMKDRIQESMAGLGANTQAAATQAPRLTGAPLQTFGPQRPI
jgi:prophage DNA circulation protein